MYKLIKHGEIVEDRYLAIADDHPVPPTPVIVSLERWQEERASLLEHSRPVGVRVPNNVDIATVAPSLEGAALVALEFPISKDGRAYSQARQLREIYGFKGELRATGALVHDQLFYMHRCGFDAFEFGADQPLEQLLRAFNVFTITYQAAADEHIPVYRRRHAHSVGEES